MKTKTLCNLRIDRNMLCVVQWMCEDEMPQQHEKDGNEMETMTRTKEIVETNMEAMMKLEGMKVQSKESANAREATEVAQNAISVLDEFVPAEARAMVDRMLKNAQTLQIKENEDEISHLKAMGGKSKRIKDLQEITDRLKSASFMK